MIRMPVLIRRAGRPWNAGSSRYRRPAMTEAYSVNLAAAARAACGCHGPAPGRVVRRPDSSEPSFRRATGQPGDLPYPIGARDQALYVPGRMRVREIVPAGATTRYCRRSIPHVTTSGGSWRRPALPR
jgi:hypothetical protein